MDQARVALPAGQSRMAYCSTRPECGLVDGFHSAGHGFVADRLAPLADCVQSAAAQSMVANSARSMCWMI